MITVASMCITLPHVAVALENDQDVTAVQGHHLAIAAVVGEDAISSYDVENRVRFIIATARLSDTPEIIAHIRPQVLRSLIDEHLQTQEATKNDIKVTSQEIDQAIAAIEEQRNMPPGTIFKILQENNIPKESFTQQIHAQLLWNKLLVQKVRPLVHITDEEVDRAKHTYTPAVDKKTASVPQEFKIAVIALPVDKESRDKEVHSLGDKLVAEVRNGASFEEVSRQFSSVAASSGGKVETFWIRLEQLDPNVAHVLSTAKSGTITDPVRTSEGYTIIKVYDTRSIGIKKPKITEKPEESPKDVEVSIKEILLKLKSDADAKEASVMLQIGQEVAKNPGACDEKGVASIDDLKDFDIDITFRKQLMSDLPPGLKVIAENQKIGDISSPVATFEGIRLYMLCDKKEVNARPVNRDEVYHMILQQRMDLEAQKYLRNLRRETFIDIR